MTGGKLAVIGLGSIGSMASWQASRLRLRYRVRSREDIIVASGGWSQRLMPEYLKAATVTKRVFRSWFVAKDGAEFTPESFPSSSGSTRTGPCMVRPPWMGSASRQRWTAAADQRRTRTPCPGK
ncbi:hypothetical protein ACX801_20575 [Arthrobacter bambusae]